MSTGAAAPRGTTAAARWSAIGAGGGAVFDLVRIAMVAVLLPPGEIGLAAFALVLVQFAIFIQDAGVSAGLVQRSSVDRAVYSSAFWFTLTYAAVLTAAIFLLARPAEEIFDMDGLGDLLNVAGLIFFFSSAGQVQRYMLLRDLRYRELAVAEIVAALIGTCVTLALAVREPTAMAMIAGRLTQQAFTALVLFALVQRRYRLALIFSWTTTRFLLSFGIFVSADQLLNFFANQADRFFIGVFFGVEILGVYHVAANLTSNKARSLGTLMYRLLFPTMAKKVRDSGDAAWMMDRAHQFIFVFMAIPLLNLVIAFMLVGRFLPTDWLSAVPVTQILVFGAILILLRVPVRSIMFANGHASDVFIVGVVGNLVLTLGVYVAARYGTVYAVAGTVVLSECLRLVLLIARMRSRGLVATTSLVRRTWLIGVALLVAAVLAQGVLMWGGVTSWPAIASAGGLMAAATVWVISQNVSVATEVSQVMLQPLAQWRRRPGDT